MSVCDKNCWDCVFRTTLSFYGIVCNFLGVMGRRRECPAGKDCEQKIAGKKRESLEARLYKMPPNPERKASSLSSGMPGIGPEAQYPKDSGGTSSPNRSGGSDLGTKEEEEKIKAEEAARIAEKKRKKAEYHREWAKKNREKVLAYQRERWRKKRETEERIATSAAPPRNDEGRKTGE